MAVPTLLAGEIPDAAKWTTILSFLGSGVIKPSNENLAGPSTTFQNDDDLRFTYGANSIYEVSASIIHSSNATADFKFQMADTGVGISGSYFDVTAIPAGGAAVTIQSGALGTTFTGEGASADRPMLLIGWITTGATTGDLVVQWAQNTGNASTTSVQKNSRLSWRRLT